MSGHSNGIPRVPAAVLLVRVIVIASGMFILGVQGRAFPLQDPKTGGEPPADYLDRPSGIVLRGQVDLFKRSNFISDWPIKGATCAAYETIDYTEGLGRMLQWYAVKAEVRIIPSATPESSARRAVEIMLRAVEHKYPDFKGTTYEGETVFGGTEAVCGQGSIKIPARSDRAVVQVIVVSKGQFLVLFRFIFPASRQKNFEPEINQFVMKILGERKP